MKILFLVLLCIPNPNPVFDSQITTEVRIIKAYNFMESYIQQTFKRSTKKKKRNMVINDLTLSAYPRYVDIDYSRFKENNTLLMREIPDLPDYLESDSTKLINLDISDTTFIKNIGDFSEIKSRYKAFFSPMLGDFLICELRDTLHPWAHKYLCIFRFNQQEINKSFIELWNVR